MLENMQLIGGIALLIVSVGVFVAFLPRDGKALSIVRRPLVAPALTVLVIGAFAWGVVEVVASFTKVDEITLSGEVRQ